MKEFRSLDEKRLAGGLTPSEALRHAELREIVSGDAGAGATRPGFDVEAAAARLRESLLPAGLRNRPPPTPPAVPVSAPELLPAADAFLATAAAAPPAEPYSPAPEESLFDPASLGEEASPGAWDPNAQPYAYDPAQPYDPSAQPYAYDPAQPYDPSAQPYAYDPAQPYDPSGELYAYDPAQPYDPSAQLCAYDPAQPHDPAGAAGLEESGALPAAAELAGIEPSEDAAPEPTEPFDPVAAYEAGADEGWEAVAPGPLAPAATDVAAWLELVDDAAAGGALVALAGADPEPPGSQQGDAEAAAPADTLPALELDPGEPVAGLPAPTDGEGELADDAHLEWLDAEDLAPAELREEDPGLSSIAAAAEPLADGELSPGEPGELLRDAEPRAASLALGDAASLPPAGWDVEPPRPDVPVAPAFGAYDDLELLPPVAEPEAAPLPALEPSVAAAPLAAELGEYDDLAPFAAPAPEELPPELPVEERGFLAPQALPSGGAAWDADLALEGVPLDGFHLESGGSFDAAAPPPALDAPGSPPPWERDAAERLAPTQSAPGPLAPELPDVEPLPTEGGFPVELALEDEEDLPTIDGEDILEEIVDAELVPEPPPAEAAAEELSVCLDDLAPEPEPADTRVPGVHRVVVHTADGQVRRGVLEDADLGAATLALVVQPGGAPEWIETEGVKAIFFMLAPGERAPAPEGRRVRVTFVDGRQVAGWSPDYREDREGFFVVPGDSRTHTARIWVYRTAARQVTVS